MITPFSPCGRRLTPSVNSVKSMQFLPNTRVNQCPPFGSSKSEMPPNGSPTCLPLATESGLAYAARTLKKTPRTYTILEGECAGAKVCPLSHIEEGTVVCIKKLSASKDVTHRLREMGLC